MTFVSKSRPRYTRVYLSYLLQNDEGIEILTGVPAGERREDGSYPENTINFLVNKSLKEMAEKLKGFYAEEKKEGK